MCELEKLITSLAPLLSAAAAIAAAFAAFKANEISTALKRLQRNSILNQREIQLLSRALGMLCKTHHQACYTPDSFSPSDIPLDPTQFESEFAPDLPHLGPLAG